LVIIHLKSTKAQHKPNSTLFYKTDMDPKISCAKDETGILF